ncbi:hypothetical protein P3T76_013647 [Phytophthora citrophthora]|uniref:Uncharacterized protein n=1 Tax=Phytophthora citrophthora TaxID=4793 RepID=A0AAD9G2R6_9STRA|nr:hypothetical protein P3T76_013647 [Phytophthora citrophthora]
MSALRERSELGEGATQYTGNGSSFRSFSARGAAGSQPSRDYYASDQSSVSVELLQRLNITSEEGEEAEENYRMPGYESQMPADQRRRAERRGSYGNVSDSGDTGIFEFDDQ